MLAMTTNHVDPALEAIQPHAAATGSVANAPRVLLAEDETLVAILLEDDLRAAGYTIVGPFMTLAKAIQASRHEQFDLAVLDVNLNGEMIFPLAEELRARGIPFALLSGYGPTSLPEQFRTLPRISKPYDPDVLLREIQRIVPKNAGRADVQQA
jgi:DNA-binding response OmpR family regulator